jgi:hypothetical protein
MLKRLSLLVLAVVTVVGGFFGVLPVSAAHAVVSASAAPEMPSDGVVIIVGPDTAGYGGTYPVTLRLSGSGANADYVEWLMQATYYDNGVFLLEDTYYLPAGNPLPEFELPMLVATGSLTQVDLTVTAWFDGSTYTGQHSIAVVENTLMVTVTGPAKVHVDSAATFLVDPNMFCTVLATDVALLDASGHQVANYHFPEFILKDVGDWTLVWTFLCTYESDTLGRVDMQAWAEGSLSVFGKLFLPAVLR